jgi:hypothetical protein
MEVLSEMDGQALCYPAFALVVLVRKSYRDGVNLSAQGPAFWLDSPDPQ